MKQFVVFLAASALLMSCQQPVQQESPKKEGVNETLETIFTRKSVRAYTTDKVSDEMLHTLVRAGMSAPSSRDQRPWEFIIVTDRAKLDAMGEALPTAKMLKETQQAIIVCGDTNKSPNAWVYDCSAAAMNILLAAESMGLGAVWTAAHPYPERMDIVRETLQLPEHIIPLNVIPLGYPAGETKPKDKYAEEQIHRNGW